MTKINDYGQLEWIFEELPEIEALQRKLIKSGYLFYSYDVKEFGHFVDHNYTYFHKDHHYDSALITITDNKARNEMQYSFVIGSMCVISCSELTWKVVN